MLAVQSRNTDFVHTMLVNDITPDVFQQDCQGNKALDYAELINDLSKVKLVYYMR